LLSRHYIAGRCLFEFSTPNLQLPHQKGAPSVKAGGIDVGNVKTTDGGKTVPLWVAISQTDVGTPGCLVGETVTKSGATQVPEERAPEACGVETVVLCALVQVPDVRAYEACGGEAVMLCGAIPSPHVAVHDPCGGVGRGDP